MSTGPCPNHHRCLITIFLYPHYSINDVGSHHRLLILPGLGIIYGGSPQPPRESIWASAKILIEGRVEESPGGHRPAFSSSTTWDLHEAMEVQEPIAGALGAGAVTPQKDMWSRIYKDFRSVISLLGCLRWLFCLIEFFFPRGLPFAIVS